MSNNRMPPSLFCFWFIFSSLFSKFWKYLPLFYKIGEEIVVELGEETQSLFQKLLIFSAKKPKADGWKGKRKIKVVKMETSFKKMYRCFVNSLHSERNCGIMEKGIVAAGRASDV